MMEKTRGIALKSAGSLLGVACRGDQNDGGGVGGIPDVGDESVSLCAAPIIRFWRSELAVHYAHFIENSLWRACLGGALKNE